METGVLTYRRVSYFKEATLQQTCSTLQQPLNRDNIDKTPSAQWSLKTHVYHRLRKPRDISNTLQHRDTATYEN